MERFSFFMTVKIIRLPYFCWITLLVITGLAHVSVQAAMLGEIQVRSALGERFLATIPVISNGEEDLTTPCFRLVSPKDEAANGVLRNAQLVYQYDAGGGRLLIQAEESSKEPLVNVAVRVKCPLEGDQPTFQRDYRIMLDPPEYRGVRHFGTYNPGKNARSGSSRKLPALGSAWLTEEGDSVAKIAASYYPGDKIRQQVLVEGIYSLNPDLPQNTHARLEGDWRIQLPVPQGKAPPVPVHDEVPQSKTIPPLDQISPPGMTESELSLPPVVEQDGLAASEFKLRLSDVYINTQTQNNLTPEQSLQLREQLLQLQNDMQDQRDVNLKLLRDESERGVDAHKQNQSIETMPSSDSSGIAGWIERNWIWSLLMFVLLSIGLVGGRRWLRGAKDDDYPIFAPSSSPLRNQTNFDSVSPAVSAVHHGGLDTQRIGTPIHRDQREEWHTEDMDVVSPGNVTEEAQLLLDHGLIPQAINLLSHEIQQHPAALALWMKLFEIFQANNMSEAFQEKAVAFRLQFASDALWKNVQQLGAMVDPANPLYQSLDIDDSIIPYLEVQGGESGHLAFSNLLKTETDQAFSELQFTLQDELVSLTDKPAAPSPYTLTKNAISEPQAVNLVENPIEIEAVSITDELNVSPPQMHKPLSRAANADYQSDDPVLQEIALLIDSGQRKEAFRLLEEMLYKGTMPQRLTASKWLDKMLGTFGHG
ncbi:FimV family protein [Chitinibacter sp. S2-10]|uniref:type IV pilus assembly protein FimV n=1 Tax=Chitinibacter sp. S2-10 TaxID=3373597 RepID=UPI003977B961